MSDPELERFIERMRELRKRIETLTEDMIRREMERISEEIRGIERLVRPLWYRDGSLEPLYTIEDLGDRYIVYIDVPYVDEQRIEVHVYNNKLMTVRAGLKRRISLGGVQRVYGDIEFKEYKVYIELPSPVDPKGAQVAVRKGVLRIVLPKYS